MSEFSGGKAAGINMKEDITWGNGGDKKLCVDGMECRDTFSRLIVMVRHRCRKHVPWDGP